MAENHHIIEDRIADNASHARQHGQVGLFSALNGGGVHAVDRGEQISRSHDAQIFDRQLKAFAGGQETGHHLTGKQHPHRGEHRRDDQRKAHGQSHGPPQTLDVPRAPVLAHENGASRAGAEAEQIEHKGESVGLCHGRIGRVAQRGHHQPIHDVQRAFHQRLQHHGQRHQKNIAGKGFIPAQAFPEKLPQPGSGGSFGLHKGSFPKRRPDLIPK